jgi:hemolysin activation/secretion protein
MRFLFKFLIFLFFILNQITSNLYAGIASGPAIHDRNVIPLPRPLTELKTDSPTQVVDPITGIIRIDDSGSRSTGFTKGLLGISFNDFFKKRETITIREIRTSGNGTDYLELGTKFSVAADGSTLAFRVGAIKYDVGQQNAAADATGNSDFIDTNFIKPFFKSKDLNFSYGISAIRASYIENRTFIISGTAPGTPATDKIDQRVDLSLYFNSYDKVFNQAGTTGKISFSKGDNNANHTKDDLGGPTGSFSKVTAQVNRLEKITEKDILYIRFKGQYALTPLDAAEEFSLGGLYNVRAYPNSEGGGADNADSGFVINFELERMLAKNVKAFAFYDFGKISIYENYGDSTEAKSSLPINGFKANKNTYNLKGTGLGLEWEAMPNTKFNMLWAHKLGNNPGRRTDDSDFDRTSIKDLIRLGFSQQF